MVPRGFAHGYLVTSETAGFNYKCDNVYNKAAEGGLAYNDPALGIAWPQLEVPYLLSPKDEVWPNLSALEVSFLG
jgi:dTDP-4-dehydrorhamnose 3,5-epimerase